jgi:hypothetical protein
MLLSSSLGVVAGLLLLALKGGAHKGRQKGEVLPINFASCCSAALELLSSSFCRRESFSDSVLEQFLEGLSACVLECCPCWLASSLKVSCCPAAFTAGLVPHVCYIVVEKNLSK